MAIVSAVFILAGQDRSGAAHDDISFPGKKINEGRTMMNRTDAREIINSKDITILYPFKKSAGYMYNCPVCGSGTGANKTGALRIRQGQRIKCFANNCFSEMGEDNVGALRILWSCSEDEVFNRVLGEEWQTGNSPLTAKNEAERTESRLEKRRAAEEWTAQIRDYIERSSEAIRESPSAVEYMRSRGITEESIKRFEIGFDEARNMIVLPYNRNHTYYEGRYISPKGSMIHHFPKQEYNGIPIEISKPVFNIGAILNNSGKDPVFIVESVICAISIMQEAPRTRAIAIGGTSGIDALAKVIEARKATDNVYIICLDNDNAGKTAQKGLIERLSAIGAKYIECNIAGDCKDPNEALVSDKTELIRNIYDALDKANEERKAKMTEYIKQNSNQEYLLRFNDKIKCCKKDPCVSTGLSDLDNVLDGGLYAGMYVIGAISSLGKTTLCMQIMDNIAASGRDVLIFSLEMARDELISKSISRHTLIEARKPYETGEQYKAIIAMAKSCRDIADGSRYEAYSTEEKDLIDRATAKYSKYCQNVFIVEGVGDIGVTEIRKRTDEHISITGRKPVVLIDYLQILPPYKDPEAPNRHFTDKQAVDKNVLEMKRMSRDLDIPVVLVSSFNRGSYEDSSKMSSFKESGGIEYSADVLIGLEYTGIEKKYDRFGKVKSNYEEIASKNREKTQKGDPIEITAKILKYRAGVKDNDCILDYFPKYNAFFNHGEDLSGDTSEPDQEPEPEQLSFTDVTDDEIDVPF